MRLRESFLAFVLLTFATPAVAEEVRAPSLGFYRLELKTLHDPEFPATKVPALTYWYSEVDAEKIEEGYAVKPAAANRHGDFVTTKIRVNPKATLPSERYSSEMKWDAKSLKGGVAELAAGEGGETLLRLFAKKKKKPLADFRLVALGVDQPAAAAALGIDPKRFAKTIYLSHRGVANIPVLNRRGVFAGNTREAMEHALWNGYPGFEIDVQLTKDKVLVVSHDQKLNVSTDCEGTLAEKNYAEVAKCSVGFTGVVPDVKAFHNRALVPGAIPTLKEILDRYLPDPRVRYVSLDVKPGDADVQVETISALLSRYPDALAAKLIFLMRSTELIHRLEGERGHATPLYAWEGTTGWETLERASVTSNADEIFQGNDAEALSLSLGLGLGMSGGKGGGLAKIFSVLKTLPKALSRLYFERAVDIDVMAWSRRNKAALERLTDAASSRGDRIVGWTVNTPTKIRWLRKHSPDIDFVLSDLPYRRLAELHLAELDDALTAR